MRVVPSLFTSAMLVAAAVPAQTPVRVFTPVLVESPVPEIVHRPGPSDVVGRIHSFDRNGDTRISRDELPDRMHALLQLHDEDGDGVLSASEVVGAARDASRGTAAAAAFRNTTATLADIVADLRLPQPRHDAAMTLAGNHRLPLNTNTLDRDGEELYRSMRDLLNDEEFENFVAGVKRVKRPRMLGGIVSAPAAGGFR
jgi:hypothetical protein